MSSGADTRPPALPDAGRFRIGFDPSKREELFTYWNDILDNQQWSEGKYVRLFEDRWSEWNGLSAVATSSWAGAAAACLDYLGVAGRKVLCPTNTFMATPLSILNAGGEVVFADCNTSDLCLSYDAVAEAMDSHDLAAVWLVHIGGHIAFDTPRIADLCRSRGIPLLEDCAHAHGASWRGRRPGTWGTAGVFSLYATKTISTGEGGVVVSRDPQLVEYATAYRNYGKPDYAIRGTNHRMSEFTAALGVVQLDSLTRIVEWKNEFAREHLDPMFDARLRLPDEMTSGLYKYIVFEPVERSTGKVYDTPCHEILGYAGDFPNSAWVAQNHWCVPLYFNPV